MSNQSVGDWAKLQREKEEKLAEEKRLEEKKVEEKRREEEREFQRLTEDFQRSRPEGPKFPTPDKFFWSL